jgi:hypothetical protein
MCLKMKMIPRVDIDPILFPKNISEEEKHNRLIQLSKSHALNHLESKTNITISTLSNFQPMLQSYGTSFFLVEMMIGSPIPYQPLLLLDTGSDLTWIQCDNCIQPYCFPIQYGNFKSRESQTVQVVSCDDEFCVPKKCGSHNQCIYELSYLSGPSTIGIVLSDNFTFPDRSSEDNDPFVNLIPVYFGCSLHSQNINFGKHMDSTNVVGGLFGLGRGPRSFLVTWRPETNLRFSYCLSSPQTQPQSPKPSLYFGDDAKVNGDIKTTQLISKLGDEDLSKYYVACTGISLSGTMLSIDPELFELKPGKKGGFIFDSGSYITLLTKNAYDVLRKSVVSYFKQKGFDPVPFPTDPLDLCYNNVPNDVPKPSMSYHFEGDAEFEVDPDSLFESFGSLLCLGVVPLPDENAPNIMGVRHQQNHAILFDVRNNLVSFSSNEISCSDYNKI